MVSGWVRRAGWRVQYEERHAAAVIRMEMGKQDEIDPIALDAQPVHRDQRGGAAIDQEIRSVPTT